MHSTPVYRVWAPSYGHLSVSFVFVCRLHGCSGQHSCPTPWWNTFFHSVCKPWTWPTFWRIVHLASRSWGPDIALLLLRWVSDPLEMESSGRISWESVGAMKCSLDIWKLWVKAYILPYCTPLDDLGYPICEKMAPGFWQSRDNPESFPQGQRWGFPGKWGPHFTKCEQLPGEGRWQPVTWRQASDHQGRELHKVLGHES